MKNLKLPFIAALSFLLFNPVYSQNYTGNEADIKMIQEKIEAFSQAYMALDYDALANCYTIDGKILPPSTDIIVGREAIKKRWTLPEGVKIPFHKISPVEIQVIGDIAHDIGYYEGRTLRKDGTEVSWEGKYLIVWKKVNEDWKIYADAWNSL